MKSYQHFATVLAQLLGNETAVRLTVKTAGLDGTRLNPRKSGIQRWREGFAEARSIGFAGPLQGRWRRETRPGASGPWAAI